MAKGLKITAIVIAIIGLIFIFVGFDKKNNYENSDYVWGEYKNAYVGGDAYNYIINGTYFTGYAVVGGSLLIIGGIFFVGAALIEELEANRSRLNNLASNSPKSSILTTMAQEAEERHNTASGVWKCPTCGKNNPSYIGTCGCGCEKP